MNILLRVLIYYPALILATWLVWRMLPDVATTQLPLRELFGLEAPHVVEISKGEIFAQAQALYQDGLRLAALTGFRRADLVSLTWDEVGEFSIVKKAAKTSRGRRNHAQMPRIPSLESLLNELESRHRAEGVNTVLVNSFGRPWTGDGFGTSFNRVRDAAQIVHVDAETGVSNKKHVHDLRGTFCTKLIQAGLTDLETASIMAWSPQQVAGIRRSYVDQRHVIVALGERLKGSL